MKYGILGDIHGNLSALERVLARFEKEGVDKVLSVGDVVGYGAAPRECIAILREVSADVVLGNHDAAVIGELDDIYFNNYARAAVEWTRNELAPDDMAWLRTLPLIQDQEHCTVGHGTIAHPELFDYIQSPTDADPSLDVLERPVGFVGHSHVPLSLLRMNDDRTRTAYTVEPEVDLSEASRTLVNVGSVGQPRDEDCRAAYAIFDSDAEMVWIRRVEYDIALEANRIREAGLPSMLADRLFLGV